MMVSPRLPLRRSERLQDCSSSSCVRPPTRSATAVRGAKLIGRRLIAGVAGGLDDQIATCKKRLVEISEELKSASGERRSFLLQVRHQWEGKLEIVRLMLQYRQSEIENLQAELEAWNIPPED